MILKQIYFIYNPNSGRASIGSHLDIILDHFTSAGYQVTVHPTQYRGDATACAKMVCDSGCYDLIVCSGGDGTLNEVINGCMTSEKSCEIGYIPFGSTNDFAWGIGIPKNPKKAVACILNGEPTPCDVGRFNKKNFIYIAAFGIFTEVSYQTPQKFKNVLGYAAYILNAFLKMPKIHSCHMRIVHDSGVIEDEFIYGMVTNSTSVANQLFLSDVQFDDGLFEVMLIRKPANLVELYKLVTAFSKIQIGFKKRYLCYFRTSKLCVINLDDKPVPWTIDGEYGGTDKVNEISILQKAVTFRIDPAFREQAKEFNNTGIANVIPSKEKLLLDERREGE